MPFETALAREATISCNAESFGFSSSLSASDAVKNLLSRPWFIGLAVTLVQLLVAVLLLAPEGPLSYRYQSLVQHDGYWFANIIDRGYQTIIPPINHKVMEVSNVAFFLLIRRWPVCSVLFSVSKLRPRYSLLRSSRPGV